MRSGNHWPSAHHCYQHWSDFWDYCGHYWNRWKGNTPKHIHCLKPSYHSWKICPPGLRQTESPLVSSLWELNIGPHIHTRRVLHDWALPPLQSSSFLVTLRLNHHPWQVVLAIAAAISSDTSSLKISQRPGHKLARKPYYHHLDGVGTKIKMKILRNYYWLCAIFSVELGIEPNDSHMPTKGLSTEPYPGPIIATCA